MKFDVNQWDEIRTHFEKMFDGLGSTETSGEILSYSSIEPHVPTGIKLSRDGKMAANMPLHDLDSTFQRVKFDELLEELTLIGEGFTYTYRIPSELLSLRQSSHQ